MCKELRLENPGLDYSINRRHWLLREMQLAEWAARRCLIGAHAAAGDFRGEIILAFDRTASKPAQHGELADMR
jgi:hypothetical protein